MHKLYKEKQCGFLCVIELVLTKLQFLILMFEFDSLGACKVIKRVSFSIINSLAHYSSVQEAIVLYYDETLRLTRI